MAPRCSESGKISSECAVIQAEGIIGKHKTTIRKKEHAVCGIRLNRCQRCFLAGRGWREETLQQLHVGMERCRPNHLETSSSATSEGMRTTKGCR